MTLHEEFVNAVLDEIRKFLLKNYSSLSQVPRSLTEEAKLIANQVRNTRQPTQIRTYLQEYIGLTSSFWRSIAPYTIYNKLLSQLELVLKKPEFSAAAIQIAHLNSIHEHYLEKQKELIEPLQTELQALRSSCQSLQNTVTCLREENERLTLENEFFMKELLSMQTQMTHVAIAAAGLQPPTKKEPSQSKIKNYYEGLPDDDGAIIYYSNDHNIISH